MTSLNTAILTGVLYLSNRMQRGVRFLCFRKWKGSDCAFSKYIDFYTVDFINPMTQQMVTTKKRNFTKNARHLNHSYEIFLGSRYPDYGNAIKKVGKQCLKKP